MFNDLSNKYPPYEPQSVSRERVNADRAAVFALIKAENKEKRTILRFRPVIIAASMCAAAAACVVVMHSGTTINEPIGVSKEPLSSVTAPETVSESVSDNKPQATADEYIAQTSVYVADPVTPPIETAATTESIVTTGEIELTTAPPNSDTVQTVPEPLIPFIPEPFGNESYGGDTLSGYSVLCSPLLTGIPYELITRVGTDGFEKWLRSVSSNELTTDIAEQGNLYSFMCVFDVDDDTIRDILKREQEIWLENDIQSNFTDEQIEAIISRDKDLIAELFVSELAIYSNGEIFTPSWLYNSPLDMWRDKKLPAEQVREKVSLALTRLPFSKEGAAYFANKCDEYCATSDIDGTE